MIYSLHLEAELKNLGTIRDFVEEAAVHLQANPTAIPNVVLAVDEMATNIIEHGYRGQPGTIEVEVYAQNEALIVQLRDRAPLFDPTQVPPPDLSLPIDDRPAGGLGIYLARKVMDDIQHRVTADNGNELTLIKNHIIQLSSGGPS